MLSARHEFVLDVVLVDVDEHVRCVRHESDTAGQRGEREYHELDAVDYQRNVLPVFHVLPVQHNNNNQTFTGHNHIGAGLEGRDELSRPI